MDVAALVMVVYCGRCAAERNPSFTAYSNIRSIQVMKQNKTLQELILQRLSEYIIKAKSQCNFWKEAE